jgi:hypothetical protein
MQSANGAPNKRFELPALDFKFASLTDGTNIPPPPPSPKKERKPEPPAKTAETIEANGSAKANGTASNTASQVPAALKTATAGTKRAAEDLPNSPTSSTGRPSSIRRLFSRNLLNKDYANAEQGAPPSTSASQAPTETASTIGARPVSRSNGSFQMDDKRAKRSSSWFRRLSTRDASTAGSKRASQMYSNEDVKKTMGPPPPMIPELTDLDSKVDVQDGGSLGNDLFKNIRIKD